jgi:hypothetical protein
MPTDRNARGDRNQAKPFTAGTASRSGRGTLRLMDTFDLSAPVPWPSANDDLFGSAGGPWRGVANVQGVWGIGTHPTVYAVGYREAAEVLVKHVLDTGYHTDFLVYPIMFLYRQYVELRLKEIAVLGARLVDATPPPDEVTGGHALEPLWKFCRVVVEKADSGPTADLDNAERTLDKLTWADPGSFAFRYATNKNGSRSLPKGLTIIDIARVNEVMSGIGNLLDGIVDFIHAEQDAKDEWLSEMVGY